MFSLHNDIWNYYYYNYFALSAGAVEYTNWISAVG